MQRAILSLFVIAISLKVGPGTAGGLEQPAFVYPCAKARTPIRIDGAMGASEWPGAVEVSGFTLSKSDQLVAEQTTMRVAYDTTHLYVGVNCREPLMGKLVARVKDWDGRVWHDDAVEIFVDVGHTHKVYYQFIINALGTGYDGKSLDSLWSGKWKCAATRGRDAWCVEAALPFASLEMDAPTAGAILGFNVCRERRAGGGVQLLNWSNVQGNFHRPQLFGHLLFLDEGWSVESLDRNSITSALGPVRLFVSDGYWALSADSAAKHVTYRSLLRAKVATVPDVSSLEAELGEGGAELLLMRFQPIQDQVDRVRKLIKGSRPVRSEDWAVSAAILDGLAEQLGTIYWRIKLDLLLKEL